MPRRIYKPEEIIAKLRQVEVVRAGLRAIDTIRSIGVTDATYYRWRQEYGRLKVDQLKRLKELEAESARLRRAVSDLTLEKLVLKEVALTADIIELARRYGRYDIGALRHCCIRQVGRLTRNVLLAFGVARDFRFHNGRPNARGFGSMKVHASGCALSGQIMSGLMILSRTEPMMGGRSGC
jgi:putative transposase